MTHREIGSIAWHENNLKNSREYEAQLGDQLNQMLFMRGKLSLQKRMAR